MIEVLSESTPKARKDYDCMACEFILNNGIDGMGFTRPELRIISKARKSGYKILKGDVYMCQNNKFDGELYTFKAIPEIAAICFKYDLFAA